jgi:hypothetical protein
MYALVCRHDCVCQVTVTGRMFTDLAVQSSLELAQIAHAKCTHVCMHACVRPQYTHACTSALLVLCACIMLNVSRDAPAHLLTVQVPAPSLSMHANTQSWLELTFHRQSANQSQFCWPTLDREDKHFFVANVKTYPVISLSMYVCVYMS